MVQPTSIASTSKVLTANDLIWGDVVYLAPDGDWVRRLADAKLFTDAQAASAALAQADQQQNQIISAFLTDARLDQNARPEPTHLREQFRANGPSNRFLGKQADTAQTRGE
jgi:hypothetical protein